MNKTLPILCALLASNSLAAKTITLTQADQTNLAITLYTDNLALVQDSRILGSITKQDTVVVKGISQQMHPQSLQIQNAGKITEQTLNREIVTYQGLIKSHIGKHIVLVKEQKSGDEIRQKVKLLNVSGNTAIVELNESIESIPLQSNTWRLVFPSKPADMLLKPSLTFKSQGKNTTNNIQLNYLSNGLEWRMDYVLELNQARTEMQLKALASLFNNTNTYFNKASIKLLAGNISRPNTEKNRSLSAPVAMAMMAKAGADTNNNAQNMGDLKLYKLPQQANLKPQQQTQIPLLQANKVPVTAGYRYHFYVNPYLDSNKIDTHPQTFLSFTNNKKSQLGIPLPTGQARVFNPDANGDLQFIGASQLRQSTENELIEIATGQAFDVSIKQQQTNYEKTFNGALVGIQFIITNSSKQAKTLDLSGSFSHSWEIISSTFPTSEKRSANAQWKIEMRANSSIVFNLNTRLKTKK
ncbi:MAG: hypothetical protein V7784_06915 [Oceanospirillaceae bacterium]